MSKTGVKKKKRLTKKQFNKTRAKIWLGKKLPEEIKKKISQSQQGKKNHNWQGGKSFEPYSYLFNKAAREEIRKRDK